MISRHWKGIAKPEQTENYMKHLRTETFPKLSKINGFLKAYILKRSVIQGTEFLIVTVWESMSAIELFTGAATELAVVPPAVQTMMIDFDSTVCHYEIADQFQLEQRNHSSGEDQSNPDRNQS